MFITIRRHVHIFRIPTACSATSSNFHLSPRYQTSNVDVNISLDMAKLHMINISALDFCIWQHFEDYRNETQLQHLTTIPSIPVNKIYQHIINCTQHIISFSTADESTLFSHTGIICYSYWIAYTSRIGNILLLFLSVLTCQISMLTFTTR